MSTLQEIIKNKSNVSSELVATTIRLTREAHSFVEEFAEQYNLSKQDALKAFIDAGIEVAENELSPEDLPLDGRYLLLNTNKRFDGHRASEMLQEKIAAAFCNPWKFQIDKIKKGDIVFLYENGRGIVGYGKGSGITLTRPCNGMPEETRYQYLEDFILLKKPMPASEVKKNLNHGVVFLRTMSPLRDGQRLLHAIEKNEA